MFVTFEGLDLSGKSTQAERLLARLRGMHRTVEVFPGGVVALREPGGTALSERVRPLLLERSQLRIDERAELMLFSASRAQLVAEVIRPALARGAVVVCDRFYDSTTAYQGYGRGLDLEEVQRVNRAATGGLRPDCTVLVDITVEEMGRRARSAGKAPDRMEAAGAAFYERVRRGYLTLAALEEERFLVIDGMREVRQVEDEIWRVLARRMSVLEAQMEGTGREGIVP
jgi:dTMP kinase